MNLNEVKKIIKIFADKKKKAVNKSKYDEISLKEERQASNRIFKKMLCLQTRENQKQWQNDEKKKIEKEKIQEKWINKVVMIIYIDNSSKRKSVISTSWHFDIFSFK